MVLHLIMVSLWNRTDHYIFILLFVLLLLSFFSHLISAVAQWMSAILPSTHGVALVRISDAGLKRAARGSLKYRSPKIAIWAPSHNFVGLYLRN